GHLGANVAELEPIGGLDVRIADRRGKACETFLAIKAPGLAILSPAYAVFYGATGCKGRPWRLGDDADAIGEFHNLDDALDRRDLGFVKFLRCRALDRRTHYRAVQHARHLHVDGVLRAAVDLVRQLGPHHVLADQAKVGGLLQLLRLHLRRLHRHLREGRDLTVSELAT